MNIRILYFFRHHGYYFFFTAHFCAATILRQHLFVWKDAVDSTRSLSVLLSAVEMSPTTGTALALAWWLCIVAVDTIRGQYLFRSVAVIVNILVLLTSHITLCCTRGLTHPWWCDYCTLPFMQSVRCWMVVRATRRYRAKWLSTAIGMQLSTVWLLDLRHALPGIYNLITPSPVLGVLVREFFLEGGSTWGPTLCPDPVTPLLGGERSGNTDRLNEREL